MRRNANSERGAYGATTAAKNRNASGMKSTTAIIAAIAIASRESDVDCRTKKSPVSARSSDPIAYVLTVRCSVADRPKPSSEERMKPVEGVTTASERSAAARCPTPSAS
jgi:hypothetical protein